MAKEVFSARETSVRGLNGRGKSIEDIQLQVQNMLRRTNSRSRSMRITQIGNRYVQNIASSDEYRAASYGADRALMNGNAREFNRYNDELDRLNNRRASRSTYMR